MPHKRKKDHAAKRRRTIESRRHLKDAPTHPSPKATTRPGLEIVLKCGSAGCIEAATSAIYGIPSSDVDIIIIRSGVGMVNKSDIMMAETGSRLIVGFEVDVMPDVKKELRDRNVEVRLYDVIYKMTGDITGIVKSIVPAQAGDQVLGTAKVIALFPGSKRGIIIGCEVLNGYLAVGERFRIIAAMGTVYTGVLDSIHIEKDAVRKATQGQRCGVKIRDFNHVKIDDIVESFRPQTVETTPWKPQGRVLRMQ